MPIDLSQKMDKALRELQSVSEKLSDFAQTMESLEEAQEEISQEVRHLASLIRKEKKKEPIAIVKSDYGKRHKSGHRS